MLEEPDFDFVQMRAQMVEEQLRGRDITDEKVLAAMAAVAREKFVEAVDWDEAYEDHPLAIACRQTISQPYIVALMTQMLEVQKGMKILEIGTGCGYQTAVLAELGAEVYSVERHKTLSQNAEKNLEKTGYAVHLKIADGSLGWPECAPYDRIIMTCCAPELKDHLLSQLSINGIMVAPVAQGNDQFLKKVIRKNDNSKIINGLPVMFVPLIGADGFSE